MSRTRDPEGSRERLVEAAIEVFADKGFHEALVEEIARASKVSKGAFYLHFPTKQALFLELLDVLAKRLTDRVSEAIAKEEGSVARLDAALRMILRTFGSHRSMSRLVLTQAGAAGRLFESKLFEVHTRFAAMIRGYLEASVASGEIAPVDTEATAWIWFGAINEVVLRWLYSEDPRPLDEALPPLRLALLRSIGVDAPSGAGHFPLPLGEG